MTLQIHNIAVHETLSSDNEFILYHGTNIPTAEPIFLKLVPENKRNDRTVAKLRHEQTVLRELQATSVPSVIRLVEENQIPVGVVMQNGHTVSSLARRLEQGHLPTEEFFPVAIALADALEQIHRNGTVHKALTPRSILLVHEQAKQGVLIVDFTNASRLSAERQELRSANALEMDLHYISPEQTGRMNRVVDWRTDMYSLGVIFYQMLTGRVPFVTDDAMSMIHAHIALRPTPPHEVLPSVPKPLSDVVMKLLAKTAEERYQSGIGLKAELEACRAYLQGEQSSFVVGKLDISDTFHIPQKLYGREEEVRFLLECFAESAVGKAQLLLVGGYSGVGKSALINEVHKPMVERRGYFIQGKFDQFKRNIPLSAVVQAFGGLVKQLLSEPEAALQQWRERLLEALGSNGGVIVELLPDLERIIGKQAPLPELGAQEAQNRFYYTVERFVKCFATPAHPLVLFLDDLQWADTATLNLLTSLMANADKTSLLIIGAYRNNEVDTAHPFMQAVASIERSGGTVTRLMLKPLDTEHIAALVGDTVHRNDNDSRDLAMTVWKKTEGNPFFVGEMLQALYRQNILHFDRAALRWQWSMDAVTKANVSDNVVELMINRLRELPDDTQHIVRLASCMGNMFRLSMVAIIAERTEHQIASALWSAVQEGLILPVGDGYKFIHDVVQEAAYQEAGHPNDHNATIEYQFLHDRVQQAAYSMIAEGERKNVHLKIARLLVSTLNGEEINDALFDIMSHYNRAIEFVDDTQERILVAELNIQAAKQAQNSSAYSAAKTFAETAIAVLPWDAWQQHTEIRLAAATVAVESCAMLQEHDELYQHYNDALKHTSSIVKSTPLHITVIRYHTTRGDRKIAADIGLDALSQFGISIPKNPPPPLILWNLLKTQQAVNRVLRKNKWQVADLVRLPVLTDEVSILRLNLLAAIAPNLFAAYINAFPILVLQTVTFSVTTGYIEETIAPWFAAFGFLQTAVVQNAKKGFEWGLLAEDIVRQLGSSFVVHIPPIEFALRHRQRDIRESIPKLKQYIKTAEERGEPHEMGYGVYMHFLNAWGSAMSLPQLYENVQEHLLLVNKYQLETASLVLEYFLLAYKYLTQSLPLSSAEAFGKELQQAISMREQQGLMEKDKGIYSLLLALTVEIAGRLGLHNETLTFYEQLLPYQQAMPGYAQNNTVWFTTTLAALSLLQEKQTHGQHSWWKLKSIIRKNSKHLKRWANDAPMNYAHRWAIIEAEMMILANVQERTVRNKYDEAIALANSNGFVNDEALACERLGAYYYHRQASTQARHFLNRAHTLYGVWGAVALQSLLEERYIGMIDAPTVQSGTTNTLSASSQDTEYQSGDDALDLQAVIKASQTLAGEIDLERLLGKLMTVVMEASGAEKAALVLWQDGKPLVQAQTETTNTNEPPRTEVLQALPLEHCHTVLISMVLNVGRLQQAIVVADAANTGEFTGDVYIRTASVKSALAAPILNQGTLIGVLYVENNLATNVFTEERVKLLGLLSSQIAISVANALLVKSMTQMERLKKEMEMAASIQMEMLPKRLPSVPGYELNVFLQMAKEAGGDFYDVIPLNSHETAFIVGDVSGKGMPAALYMSAVMNVLRTAILQATLDERSIEPMAILKIANRMMRQTMRSRNFVTIWLGILNTDTHELRFSSAGHDPAVVWHAEQSQRMLLGTEGQACGFTGQELFERKLEQQRVILPPNALVLWNTDGITEAQNERGEEYTDERYWQEIERLPAGSTTENALKLVQESVRQFVGAAPQHDDMTLLALRRVE